MADFIGRKEDFRDFAETNGIMLMGLDELTGRASAPQLSNGSH